MTWNLQRGQAVAGPLAAADMGPFAALVAANRAEVVGLQEVTQDQARALSAALGWPPPAYVETKQPCPGFPPPLPASCVPFGDAVLSRLPVDEVEHWVLPSSRLEEGLEQRTLLRAVIEVDGRRLSVYVTHLAANATASEREAQVDAALTHIDDDGRPVWVGDFNADPTDDVVRRVRARFVDAWAVTAAEDPGATSNAVLGLTRRIDYVFVGRDSGLRVTEVRVDPAVLSDHLPVVVELEAADASRVTPAPSTSGGPS
jgi:endonuclease/exonuclease/phosphatase family metal-dependent hydrolase